MFIKEIFVKNIERDIQSVVKALDNVKNEISEIDEYVVTEEIFSFIKKFVHSYKNAFLKCNDEIGFWISGFFGSGKSHFLKILYYILNNVGVDVLIKNNLCLNQIREDIKFLSDIRKDVILFNIDSKCRKDDSILDIFVNEFNSIRGFSKNYGFVCEFEEQLIDENIFEIFKDKFLKYSGVQWEVGREKFYFYRDSLFKSLSESKNLNLKMSEKYFLDIEKNYKMNIEKFSDKVKSYILKNGENFNLVFMIDEVSQFIADDVNKMLNLQTIVEELSNKCLGKVFIVVTSHVDIISISKNKKYDFSKIQGRFANKFYLSSINMDEILYKRILLKKDIFSDEIGKIYERKEYFIRNILKFDFVYDSDIMKINKEIFTYAYPFFPYQLKILQDVIYFMMKNNVISDEISKGERSFINFFQSVLLNFKDYNLGKVVPFHMFYEPISDFIDYNHKYIFSILVNHEKLNNFDINILKVLFLIKYVPNIIPTINTITSLSISDIDEKNDFKNIVSESLKKLIDEGFVNNDGDKFYFLSKVERDVNYKILSINVSSNEIKEFLCEEIFNKICKIGKFKYQKKAVFNINQILDDLNYKVYSKNSLGLKILTTNYDEKFSMDSIRVLSSIENNVIIYFNNDKNLIDEINLYLKLGKFLKYGKSDLKDNFKEILSEKEIEFKNRLSRIEIFIINCIKNSNIFVNGEEISTNFVDVNDIVKNSINKLIVCRFNKFDYINKSVDSLENIIKIFEDDEALQKILKLNSLFLNELFNFIDGFEKINFEEIINYFKNIPYGFNKNDVLFGILYFLKIGKLFCENGFNEIINLISEKSSIDELEIIKSREISLRDFNSYKKLFGELFDKKYLNDDFNDFFHECKEDLKILSLKICEVKSLINENYLHPDKNFVENLEISINDLLNSDLYKFIKILKNNEKLIMDFEKFEIVYNFYTSVQFEIFKKGISVFEIFIRDKNFIDDENLKNKAFLIEEILKNENPYGEISKLKIYINEFVDDHEKILIKNFKIINEFIDDEIESFLDSKLVCELKNKLKNCGNLFEMYGVKMECIFLKDKILKLKD